MNPVLKEYEVDGEVVHYHTYWCQCGWERRDMVKTPTELCYDCTQDSDEVFCQNCVTRFLHDDNWAGPHSEDISR